MNHNTLFETLSAEDLHHADSQDYVKNFVKGISGDLVRKISADKNEPAWFLELRLTALGLFHELDFPSFGPDLSELDLSRIRFFASASDKPQTKSWDDVDPEIKRTFERLKIPEAERAMLAGVGAQYESENVYHNLKPKWEKKGIIFEDFDVALQRYPDLVKKYFSRCVGLADHKFAALHYAVVSGGTFLFIPKGVTVDQPLQAYFRMNAMNQGQFEHTLIIVEAGAKAHYIEGCSAPKYGSQALHAGCVEVFVGEQASLRYSSVENWSKDTFNLNTKRAIVGASGSMEWVGGNLGAGVTMLYPASMLVGNGARANHLGIAFATDGQCQDVGAKIYITANDCRASVVSKSLVRYGGISTYRGTVKVDKSAARAVVDLRCDALVLSENATADTIPEIDCQNSSAQVTQEATAGKISEEVLFYFQARGVGSDVARGMVVNGFLDEVVKTLPLEYAGELNRLIELELEAS